MDRRLELQTLLEAVLGSTYVYFQPPATVQMQQYPHIVYELDTARTEFAGNMPYIYKKRYQITVVHRDPDDKTPDKIALLESAAFSRTYTANNLHHSVFTLYF